MPLIDPIALIATITKRQRADGTTSYVANIRITKHDIVIHRESKTFDKKGAWEAWKNDVPYLKDAILTAEHIDSILGMRKHSKNLVLRVRV